MAAKLLDQVRETIRLKHLSIHTEVAYLYWIKQFILLHNKRHPKDMAEGEIQIFLSHLALHEFVASSIQNQALNALISLYTRILHIQLGQLDTVMRAKRSERFPAVFSQNEI